MSRFATWRSLAFPTRVAGHSIQNGSSKDLAISPATRLALEEKFGKDQLRDFLREYGFKSGNPGALTNVEGRWLGSFGSLDAARARISPRSGRKGGEGRGRGVRAPGEAGTGELAFSRTADPDPELTTEEALFDGPRIESFIQSPIVLRKSVVTGKRNSFPHPRGDDPRRHQGMIAITELSPPAWG